MPLKILITGSTGDAMPPPYAGVPKVSLLYARTYRELGHEVATTFVYRPENGNDLGANAEYFFEYLSRPNVLKKIGFFLKYFLHNPKLYLKLLKSHYGIYPKIYPELVLYSAYGVFMDEVIGTFKPDIILAQTALIKTFMVVQVAKARNIPIVVEPYAEIHDLNMGVNPHLNDEGRRKYWSSYLSPISMVVGMDNCSAGAQMYMSQDKVKVFYDTCDYKYYHDTKTPSKTDLRKELGLPEDIVLAGMVGAFHYRKGHDHLIKAVAMLSRKGVKNVGAAICGNSYKTLKKWQVLAEEEGVSDKIFFFVNFADPELLKFHRSLDVYCNLSNSTRSCGLDLALLEAMSSGLPVIVYDNGVLPRAVPREENGMLVETNNIEKLSEALLEIVQKTSEERSRMGEKSSEEVAPLDVRVTSKIKLGWFEDLVRNFRANR